jgi:hypothetical protein
MIFSSSLVTLQRRRRFARSLRGDLLDLVDEDHGVLELGDLEERLAEGCSQSARLRGEPRREHLDERPLEPRRDRLRERGLAGAGRAEQDHRSRRDHAESIGEVGLGERHHETLFEDLLLAMHARDRLPEISGHQPSAELGEGAEFLPLHRDPALEVVQVLLQLESLAVERVHAGLGLGHQGRELREPERLHLLLDRREQRPADSATPPGDRRSEEDDPALVVGGPPDDRADHLVAVHGDHRVILLERGEHLAQPVHGFHRRGGHLLPEVQQSLEVVAMELADPPSRHRSPPSPQPRATSDDRSRGHPFASRA